MPTSTARVVSPDPQAALGHGREGSRSVSSADQSLAAGGQLSAKPARDRNAHGVADQLPARSVSTARLVDRRRRPIGLEPLEPLGVAQVGRHQWLARCPRIQTAGGDGIPIVEPPLSVGTASTARPSPRKPSVQ